MYTDEKFDDVFHMQASKVLDKEQQVNRKFTRELSKHPELSDELRRICNVEKPTEEIAQIQEGVIDEMDSLLKAVFQPDRGVKHREPKEDSGQQESRETPENNDADTESGSDKAEGEAEDDATPSSELGQGDTTQTGNSKSCITRVRWSHVGEFAPSFTFSTEREGKSDIFIIELNLGHPFIDPLHKSLSKEDNKGAQKVLSGYLMGTVIPEIITRAHELSIQEEEAMASFDGKILATRKEIPIIKASLSFTQVHFAKAVREYHKKDIPYKVNDMLPWVEDMFPKICKWKRGGIQQINQEIYSNFFFHNRYKRVLPKFKLDKVAKTVTFIK